MRVRELMTPDVVTVSPDVSVRAAALLLVEHGISGVPVVDADARVLGVLSETDIVQKEAGSQRPGGLFHWLDVESGEIRAKVEARTAGEAMSSPAVTIEAERTINAAASLMLEKGCKRLPVLENGRLVGIVSRSDLVRAFVRSDDEIEQEIREGVALGTFAVAPEALLVKSVNGEVTLGGEVETPEMAQLLVEFVARVPGVVSVRSHVKSRAVGSP
jgi:CBS domain-containing protein